MHDFGLTFLILGASILFLPLLDAKRNVTRALVFGICIVLTWRYMVWRLSETLPALTLDPEALYAWSFTAVEVLANVGWTIGFVILSRTLDRRRGPAVSRSWMTRRGRVPRVDILIPTYNEDFQVLSRTLVGALGIVCPGTRICVLDDGRRPWVEELCAEKGVLYLTRGDNQHGKAGNMNHALAVLADDPDPPEFIAVFDADFVPNCDFLWHTMPLFADDDVGLVQTPQHFFNKDPMQVNLLLGDVWPDEQRFFFDHVMPSKDAWGAAFCCGTSSVIRLSALREIGWFPVDSVTEDFLVTLKMDERGWRTVYLNEPLSAGLAPEGMKEYLTQRSRWCLGLMQILRSRLGPFSSSRLSLAYRVGLIDAFLYWAVSSLFKLLCIVAPIVYWFTGMTVGSASASEIIEFFLPYYAGVMAALFWATGGLVQPVLTDVSHVLTMPAALQGTITGLLRRTGHVFKVTAKGGDRDKLVVQWPLVRGYGALAALTVAGVLYGTFSDFHPNPQPAELNAIVLFWSAYNVLVLLLAMTVCVELPRYRREERFPAMERVTVLRQDRAFNAVLADISLGGARILADVPASVDEDVIVDIEEVGAVAARVVSMSETEFAVEFVCQDQGRDALIQKIFSGRYVHGLRNVEPVGLWSSLVARALR